MSFKNILGQEKTLSIFESAIKNNHLAHAYIFAGQEGVGKKSFSKELAKAILCHHSDVGGCDDCSTCKRIDTDNFPDLFFLFPEKNHRIIKIEQLKYFQEIINVKPLESKYKIVVIEAADKMNEEASNCLLKTLEEPPSYAIILLIVTSLESMSETIKSRCQIVRFSPLSSAIVKKILVNQYQIDDNNADRLAFVAQGSMKRAALLLNTSTLEKKHRLADRLMQVNHDDNLTFSKELLAEWRIQEVDVLEEKRVQIKELFFSFLTYYRDMLICKTGGENLPLYFEEWRENLLTKSQTLSEENLFNILQTIRTSLEYLEYNANISLLVENMITKILYIQSNKPKASIL